jgi:predicted enzyme related to lactoylglutathione lyase
MAPAGDETAATVPPHWNVNLRVGDADATVEQAAGLGGQILLAPLDAPGFRAPSSPTRRGRCSRSAS